MTLDFQVAAVACFVALSTGTFQILNGLLLINTPHNFVNTLAFTVNSGSGFIFYLKTLSGIFAV